MIINETTILKSAVLNNITLNETLVETNLSSGLSTFNIVGLAEQSIRESKDRIYSAIINSGFDFPEHKIVVNLSPSGTKKRGTLLDLPIAISIILTSLKNTVTNLEELIACSVVEEDSFEFRYIDALKKKERLVKNRLNEFYILGEISLLGELRDDDSIIALLIDLREKGYKNFIIPNSAKNKTRIIKGVNFYYFENLLEALSFILGLIKVDPTVYNNIDFNFNTNSKVSYTYEDNSHNISTNNNNISSALNFSNVTSDQTNSKETYFENPPQILNKNSKDIKEKINSEISHKVSYKINSDSETSSETSSKIPSETSRKIPCEINNDSVDIFEKNENLDFKDVLGQDYAKRAIVIAASGMHNIILDGPPGTGKSMLSKRIPSILPNLTYDEMLNTTKIYSIASLLPKGRGIITKRPFRAPHHSSSYTAILGGGKSALPGEISLAHNGILFLDELPEFSKFVLNNLREPLENGYIMINRANERNEYPCNFMLVASLNPCPCGYLNHPKIKCTCSPLEINNYRKKISGPLLDRIDININVPFITYKDIYKEERSKTSEEMKNEVLKALEFSNKRNTKYNFKFNKDIPDNLLNEICPIEEEAKNILSESYNRYSLSLRGLNKIIKVARTIADLESSEIIKESHILEVINFRVKYS